MIFAPFLEKIRAALRPVPSEAPVRRIVWGFQVRYPLLGVGELITPYPTLDGHVVITEPAHFRYNTGDRADEAWNFDKS